MDRWNSSIIIGMFTLGGLFATNTYIYEKEIENGMHYQRINEVRESGENEFLSYLKYKPEYKWQYLLFGLGGLAAGISIAAMVESGGNPGGDGGNSGRDGGDDYSGRSGMGSGGWGGY